MKPRSGRRIEVKMRGKKQSPYSRESVNGNTPVCCSCFYQWVLLLINLTSKSPKPELQEAALAIWQAHQDQTNSASKEQFQSTSMVCLFVCLFFSDPLLTSKIPAPESDGMDSNYPSLQKQRSQYHCMAASLPASVNQDSASLAAQECQEAQDHKVPWTPLGSSTALSMELHYIGSTAHMKNIQHKNS